MDVEVGKGEVVAAEAAAVEGVVDAYRICMCQEAFPNTSPKWENPNKVICRVLTMVALPLVSRGDRQPAEAATKPSVLKPIQNIQQLERVLFPRI